MIGSLPWTAWLLLLLAVGSGLAIQLLHYARRRPLRKNGIDREDPR